jgi:hypothetical protein
LTRRSREKPIFFMARAVAPMLAGRLGCTRTIDVLCRSIKPLLLSDAAWLPWQRAGAFFPLAPDLEEIVWLRAFPLGLSIWYGMSGGKKRRAVRKTRGDAVGLLRKRSGRWNESSQTTPF